jgi:hypothetical protein
MDELGGKDATNNDPVARNRRRVFLLEIAISN